MADTRTTQYEPTKEQLSCYAIQRDGDYLIPITQMCVESGVGRTTYYGWFGNPAFASWWQTEAENHFARKLPAVYGSLSDSAAVVRTRADGSRDTQAARTLLERFDRGFKPQSKTELTGDFNLHDDRASIDDDRAAIDTLMAAATGRPGGGPEAPGAVDGTGCGDGGADAAGVSGVDTGSVPVVD